MCVAIGIGLGTAVLGTVASTQGAKTAAKATTNAANTAADATNNATAAATQVQQNALDQQRQLAQPYTNFGQSAIGPLSQLLGISSPAPATLANMPGNAPSRAAPTPQVVNSGFNQAYLQAQLAGNKAPPQSVNPKLPNYTPPATASLNRYSPLAPNVAAPQPTLQSYNSNLPNYQAPSNAETILPPPTGGISLYPGTNSTLDAGPGGYTNIGQQFAGGTGQTPSQPTQGAQAAQGYQPPPQSPLANLKPTAPLTLEELRNTPGYQFTKQEGLNSTLNAAAASGLLNSGNTLEALDRYSSGLADQTYQQEFNNRFNTNQQEFDQRFNAYGQQVNNLQNVVGLGQAAAAGQAANIGNAASNVSGLLSNQGSNLGNIATNQGNTLAGIDANQIAGITKSIGNGVNTGLTLRNLGGGFGDTSGSFGGSVLGVDSLRPDYNGFDVGGSFA